MTARTRLGVVTIVHGRHGHLRGQLRSLAAGSSTPDVHVVVAMDDPEVADVVGSDAEVVSVDRHADGLPLAHARNVGARRVLERGCDVLVFLDVDCLSGPTLLQGYADAVAVDGATIWSGPVTYLDPPPPGGYDLARLPDVDAPHPARPAPAPGELQRGGDPDLFWSLSFAMAAPAWEQVGGFHEGFVGYGGEDTDFGRLIGLAGLDLGWVGSARAYHQHHPVSSPPVEHLDDMLRNGRLFAERWGSWPMRGWFDALAERGLVERDGAGWRRADALSARALTVRGR